MKYLVMYEQGERGVSAYVPDLPGCVAAGDTIDETRALIHGAIAGHLEAMRKHGEPVPLPSVSEFVEIAG